MCQKPLMVLTTTYYLKTCWILGTGHVSQEFAVTNGVRQGGIESRCLH